jgi:glutamate racemase
MTNKPIGILDTGIGGLSVYQEIIALLPHESTIYIGDSAFAPYGRLSEDVIFERSKKLVSFLLEKDVKLIVVACNTITVSCIDKLREAFPQVPIVGTVPVVKTAAAMTKVKSFGILSSTRTAHSKYQKELIKQFAEGHTVINLGSHELVSLIEQGIIDGEQIDSILQKVLKPFQEEHIDTLALGCTHFPFIKKNMQKILGEDVTILDSGAAIARHVKRVLESKNILVSEGSAKREFYTTADAEKVNDIAKKILGGTITTTKVDL